MTAPFIVEQHTATFNSLPSLSLPAPSHFTTTPASGDVAYVVTSSVRSAGARTITGVSGLGASWALVGASGPAGVAATPRIELWKGTAPTTGGTVTVTQDNSGELHFTAFLMRGDDVATATLTPATVGLNQLAMRFAAVLGGTVTIPSSPTPATGWTQTAASVGTAGSARGAYRTPTEYPAVVHNAGYSGGTSGASLAMSFGVVEAPPPEGAGRIEWGLNGEKRWETGVSHGVLYRAGIPGVPWNGIISIDESTVGGDVDSMYFDGIKYRDVIQNEDFQASMTAYSAPPEFGECDGRKQLAAGLFATHQPRKTFDLSYRTLLGNDLLQDRLGYQLHLVYNVLASPSSRSNKTKGESPELNQLQWQLNCKPVWYGTAATYRATAHFIIDSTLVDPAILAALEDELYGTEETIANMPTQSEVISILEG